MSVQAHSSNPDRFPCDDYLEPGQVSGEHRE